MTTETVQPQFRPGALVTARDRDWLVLPGSTDIAMLARPLGGLDDEITALLPAYEAIAPASFEPPRPSTTAATPPARGCFATRCGCRSAPGQARSAPSRRSPSAPGTISSSR